MNFEQTDNDNTQEAVACMALAETSIVRMIVMGSGGPENGEITEQGLRFIRHLMSKSQACRSGFLPNLKDMNCIKDLARDYIASSGTPTHALASMYQVI
ncbi:MAG: hypothetical protein K8F91_08055 [Candidatus Obscuribacterales bacterium]|nr:hypothetical protein [Candidatus Obscuribacterales bacterium]